jgi:ionotropic kainate glutamate receptor 4
MALRAALALALFTVVNGGITRVIRACWVRDDPGPFLNAIPLPDGSTVIAGYAYDLLVSVMQRLNATSDGDTFALSLYETPDGSFGAFNESSGNWSGVIGEVVAGRADVGLGPITWTAARSPVVAFTGPWFSAPLALLIRQGDLERSFSWGFTAPFTPELWGAVLAMTLFFAAALTAAERASPYSFRNLERDWDAATKRALNAPESFTRAMQSIVGQGAWGSDASSWSTRTVVFAMSFFGLVVGTQYSGGITSSATVRRAGTSVGSFADLLATGEKWGVLAGASAEAYARASTDPTVRRLLPALVSYPDYDALLAAVRGGAVRAILDDAPLADYFASQPPCTLSVAPVSASGYYSFPAGVNATFARQLATAVLGVAEAGASETLNSKYGVGGGGGGCIASALAGNGALGVADLAGVFIAAIAICGFAFLVVVAEHIVYRCRTRPAGRLRVCARLNKCCGDHSVANARPQKEVELAGITNPIGPAHEWAAGK